ncbi:hypothetical protein GWK48_08730 [Metallosphaera tengchongensis]|uniref:Uncharacterized protein n=1 Tax=Metallosphaera tengchongensis TaxID=1532350 RepID=A0A6N0NW58_9CREN|nr:hypothetical protein [Metallosphaera tengchongensis]QKR00445.1 hypothetical protein GWK48_08730 [Metallosphaera tengchongensis]
MKYIKKAKKEKDVNIALELSYEIFSSTLGRSLGLPIPEVELVSLDNGDIGLSMDYLGDLKDQEIVNKKELGMSLPFEELLLNVDLKREHVMVKDRKGYIIDHGHVLDAWKPLYYIEDIIWSPVTRFDLWSNPSALREGVELVKQIDLDYAKKELGLSMELVRQSKLCSLFTAQVVEDHLNTSYKILKLRKTIVPRLYTI